MTGPEHYKAAERLIAEANDNLPITDETSHPWRRALLEEAQVHATLALTAATAYPAIVAYTGDELAHECRGWANATAPQQVSA